MEILRYVNDRELIFQRHNLEINWSKSLPDSNWLFVGLVETDNSRILDEIAKKIINRDVCYACCIGTFGEKLHDLIDENLVIRGTEIEKLHFPKHQIMTTWHKDFEDGLWFASFTANHETEKIEKILCLDIGKNSKKEDISDLIDKFNEGYIPVD